MKKGKKKRKIRYDRLFLAFLVLFLFIFIIIKIIGIRISNIYVTGNYYLSDQEIIDKALISDYPSVLKGVRTTKKIDKDMYIKSVKIKVKKLTELHIEVVENRPIFYSEYMGKTVLLDGSKVDDKYPVPTVLNYVVDDVYVDFIKEMGNLSTDILNRISEIEYKPDTDTKRFLLYMNDGNLVYINIKTFYKLNEYLEIIKNFPNKNGILYLDYGNNFKIIE